MNICRYLLILPLLLSTTVESIENSIIPVVEKYERAENLPVSKYAKSQYEEILQALQRKDEKIRVVSYNVLFNLYDKNLEAAYRWPKRLPRIVEVLEEMQPDIIGVQELYKDQLEGLQQSLSARFEFYAKPCEDGELNGIFYRKDRFKVVNRHVWNMSPTPDVPSSSTLTMLHLLDLKTDRQIAVFNVHLSFSKVESREFQARFIAEHIESYAEKAPIVLTGDFNMFPNFPDIESLPFYDGNYENRILTQGVLRDSMERSLIGHVGPLSTFTSTPEDGATPFKGTGQPGVFLDRIYVSKGVKVLIHAVQPAVVDGYFPSDHMPLFIDIKL